MQSLGRDASPTWWHQGLQKVRFWKVSVTVWTWSHINNELTIWKSSAGLCSKNSIICCFSWYFHYLGFKTVHILILTVHTQTKNNFLGPVHTGTLKERLPGFTEENTSEKHNFSQKFYLYPDIYFGMEMSSWSGEYIIGLFGHYFLTNLIVWISRCCIEASSKHQFCRIR